MTTDSTTSVDDGESTLAARPGPAALSSVARGSAANLIGAVVSAVCSFGLAVVITRGMSRTDAGVFFSVTSVFLIATAVGQLGTDSGLVYFLSRARRLDITGRIPDYLRAALVPVLATAVAMSVAMFVLAPQLGHLSNPDNADQATSYLRVLSLFIVPAGVATAFLSATRGLGTMRPNVVVEQVGRQSVQLLLVGVAVVALPSSTWVGWAWSLPYLLAVAFAVAWWRRVCRRMAIPARAASGEPVRSVFWKFTAPRSLASVAQLLLQRIDIVLVAAIAGPVQAAIFTAATRFVVVGQFGRNAVSLAVQPPLAAALTQDDRTEAKELFQTSAAWLIGVTWPLYLTFCITGEALLAVFGHGYGHGATILLLVSLGMLVGTGTGDVDSVLIMSGRTFFSLNNMLLALAVMIGLDLWLIPDHGAVGAAIGWGASIAVKNSAALFQVRRLYGLHPFGTATVTMVALNVVCFVAVQGGIDLLPLGKFVALAVGLVMGGALYVAGLWLMRTRLQLDHFRTLPRGVRGARTAR